MKHLLAAAVLVALLLFLITRNVSPNPYVYDEADDMYAASLGYFANWTDTPTLSLPEFLRIGMGRGRQTGGRQELPEFIRQSNDVLFYRHWHGPLYHFILIPVSRLGLNEHGVRSTMLVIPALTLLAIYFACLWLLTGLSGSLAAFLGAALFLSSLGVRSTELAPHHWQLPGTRSLDNELAARCPIGSFYGLPGAVAPVVLGKYRILRIWHNRFLSSPVEWAVVAIALALYLRSGLDRKSIRVPHPDPFNSDTGRHRSRLERLRSLLPAVHAPLLFPGHTLTWLLHAAAHSGRSRRLCAGRNLVPLKATYYGFSTRA
jgi:hypothetical protein